MAGPYGKVFPTSPGPTDLEVAMFKAGYELAKKKWPPSKPLVVAPALFANLVADNNVLV